MALTQTRFALFIAVLLVLSASASATFTVTAVDSNAAANSMSQDIDSSDYPWLIYNGPDAGGTPDLKVAYYNGSNWTLEDSGARGAFGAGSSAGLYADGVFDTSDNLYIGHGWMDSGGNTNMHYAYRTSGGSWNHARIDGNVGTGNYVGIARDGWGLPGIAYHDTSPDQLKYAKCTSAPCTNAANWHTEIVDTNTNAGNTRQRNEIVFDSSNNAHIIYHGAATIGPGGYIKHAYQSAGTWILKGIEATSFGDSAATIDNSDKIYISYSDSSSKLKYAEYSSGSWTATSLISVDNNVIDEGTDIELDSSGYPHISYHVRNPAAPTTFAIKHAYCTSAPCTNAANWTTENAQHWGANNPSGNQYNAISLDSSNLVYIAYKSGSNESAQEDSPVVPELPLQVLSLLAAIVLIAIFLVRLKRN